MVKCPKATQHEKKELLKIASAAKKTKNDCMLSIGDSPTLISYSLDSGSDCSCISMSNLREEGIENPLVPLSHEKILVTCSRIMIQ